jgi:Ca-activated chloride channel family protein
VLEFKNPAYLFLLIPFAVLVFIYWYRKFNKQETAVEISSKKIVEGKSSLRALTYPYLPILRLLSILLLILALARPGKGVDYSSVNNLGIDIMVVLDTSASMMGEDFIPKNRLHVAKLVVNEFIKGRKTDRIGLVTFAGEAFLQCPLTVEHQMITQIIDDLDFAEPKYDGTAIGEALALAASRIETSKSKSKIILLLTDGVNNAGSIDPETASKMCADMSIKIYSVGIGTEGVVKMPSKGFFSSNYMRSHFDEKAIKKLSDITGGKFFRAKSSGVLWKNIQDIDRLEKSEYEVKIYHEFYDKFEYLLFAAMFLFFFEMLLRSLVYRKVP